MMDDLQLKLSDIQTSFSCVSFMHRLTHLTFCHNTSGRENRENGGLRSFPSAPIIRTTTQRAQSH